MKIPIVLCLLLLTFIPHVVPPIEAQKCSNEIAFHSQHDGDFDIYVINVETGELRQLTGHSRHDFKPVWSPSGDRLASVSDRSGSPQIYLLQVDDGKLQQLTFDKGGEELLFWSPDGTRLAYHNCDGEGRPGTIVVIDMTTSTSDDIYSSDDFMWLGPWSPDGETLIVEDRAASKFFLCVVNSDGREFRQVSSSEQWSFAINSKWVPDSSHLFFMARDELSGGYWTQRRVRVGKVGGATCCPMGLVS